jgi:alpha-beta hydrolase superfamily lysophospholipase
MTNTKAATKTLKASFPGWNDYKLDARIVMPESIPKAFAVFCHCFTCTKDTITTFRISRALAQRGYAVLRFDFTGLGTSDGVFSQTNFTSNVSDVNAAINYLRLHYEAPTLLLGHSLGGTAVLEAAIHTDEVLAVVTVASPSQPDHVLHHFGHTLTLLEQGLPASIDVAGKHYDIDPQFIDDLRKYNMEQRLAALDKPVLIFNVTDDALVDEDNAQELQQWISGETKLVTLENSDHLLPNKQDTEFVADEIVKWFKKIYPQMNADKI